MTATVDPGRAARSDGEAAHARLLRAGLQLFARQGYAKTSTRELAEAAGVNVASISYYFGDKAGLYRAVCGAALGDAPGVAERVAGPALPLAAALRRFYERFLEPLRHGDEARLCMKLHFREMLEPSGLWEGGVARGIRPQHDALVALLCRHFGLKKADEGVQRLAVCLAGLAVQLHVGRDAIDELVPALNRGPRAVDRWIDTLAQLGLSMIEGEQDRRRGARASVPATRRRFRAGGSSP